ncbi:HK97-gp10 family putative phage morphogenesis protein [Terrihabitans rhizophilus]|uniref:HK97-gp10 family putative phage morphogenesis protein n=1 Tax=Terrihabitans rhizophilus TaxID=3092662 RepID=A0ABU4RS25_9HYPH|nr:HK97-gp10 family putative phage morphogenesis protein [Terrihabitans sp. PJ23]MDX6806430.1 HK97-gp10 family putative phage morphogenesis protein [Terrihabitans sp. PJ23]
MAKSPGLARLEKRLAAIPVEVKRAIEPALQKSGDELVARMKLLAPVDEGHLRDSIVATPAGQATPPYSQPGGAALVPELTVRVTVGNDAVRYPHLVEYGTTDAAAQPFFWPAFRLSRKRLDSRIKRAISKAVRDGWAKR